MSLSIGIAGCTGRVGQLLLKELLSSAWDNDAKLSAASVRPGHALAGQDAGQAIGAPDTGITITDSAEALFNASDIVIDFTSPEATITNAELAAAQGKALIVATTGLTAEQEEKLSDYAHKTVIVYAANMSVGVNVLLALVEQAAKTLDPAWDIEIHEVHHKHKVDAPSGTALALGKSAATGRNVSLEDKADYARHGETGARTEGDIGFSVQRGGDVVGEHTVSFYAQGERIELSHKATDRSLFAKGAIKAAIWSKEKDVGLYDMKDVLGL